MIQRTVHWALPDAYPWGVHYGYIFATRFMELMVHKPGQGLLSTVLATLLTPLVINILQIHIQIQIQIWIALLDLYY